MTTDEVLAFTKSLDMWMHGHTGGWRTYEDDELALFAECAVKAPPLNMVEIGVYHGYTASVLLQCAVVTGQRVWLVDPLYWDRFYAEPTLKKLLSGFTDVKWFWYPCESVEAHVCFELNTGRTQESPDIGFLHIDGDHALDPFKLDCWKWIPHVVSGGYVVFHDCQLNDITNGGPHRHAIALEYTPGWETVGHVGRNGCLARRKP